MSESKAKYHHLIPQTYMRAWTYGNNSLCIEKVKTGEIQKRSIAKIAGIKNNYAIMAGMPILSEQDADRIFDSLEEYRVIFDGNKLSDSLELNKFYRNFDEWEIYRHDGGLEKKNKIRVQIDNSKILDIESLWGKKYESMWDSVRNEIESKVSGAIQKVIRYRKSPAGKFLRKIIRKNNSSFRIENIRIREFEKDFLMKFYTMLDWRSIQTNPAFVKEFDSLCGKEGLDLQSIEIPKEDRFLPNLENVYDEYRHCLLLRQYRNFLNDSGRIYKDAMARKKNTSVHFLVAVGEERFITSDNPAFVFERHNGQIQGIMPITPKILLSQGKSKKRSKNYYVTCISDEAVRKYNKVIKDNASEFIIHYEY